MTRSRDDVTGKRYVLGHFFVDILSSMTSSEDGDNDGVDGADEDDDADDDNNNNKSDNDGPDDRRQRDGGSA